MGSNKQRWNTIKPMAKAATIKVWDLPIRLWHWSLVALLMFLWYSGEFADDLMQWHLWAGRAILALVLFRIIWGIAGSQTARFSQFIKSPSAILGELKGLASGDVNRHLGHNPAGGWFVVAVISLVFLQAFSGLFVTDGYLWEGPWASVVSGDTQDLMMTLHELGIKFILAAVAVHISAIVVHGIRQDHLVGAMFSGRKQPASDYVDHPPTAWRSPWLALAVLCFCSISVYFATR